MLNITARESYVAESPNLLLPKDFSQVESFDQIFLDAKDLDIKELRQCLLQFQQSPSGELRLLVINNGHYLTELLQNTLLKVVEEPPAKGVIALQIKSRESLLPTLRSRLVKISIESRKNQFAKKDLAISELFSMERSKVVGELEQVIKSLDLNSPRDIYRHNLLERVVRRVKANANIKLSLDFLGLNWDKEFGKE